MAYTAIMTMEENTLGEEYGNHYCLTADTRVSLVHRCIRSPILTTAVPSTGDTGIY